MQHTARLQSSLSRRATVVGALAIVMTEARGIAAVSPPRVLFICQAGTVKSAISREYLRRRATERGIAIKVMSRGIVPEDHVSEKLRGALVADRIDTLSEPLRRLEASDVSSADIIVFFDEPKDIRLPAGARDWTGVPSMNDNFGGARADLLARIERLLDEIANAHR